MHLDQTLLNAYLDNELAQPERDWVEQQLATSPEAQLLLKQLRAEAAQLQQGLDSLTPTSDQQSPAWLALKRLQPHLTSTRLVANGKVEEGDTTSAIWESPTLFTEIKSSFKNFCLIRMDVMLRNTPIVIGFGLIVITAMLIALSLNIDPRQPLRLLANVIHPLDNVETPAQTTSNMAELPKDTIQVSVVFNDEIELVGYKLLQEAETAEDTVNVQLYWRGLKPIETDYTVFVHLTDSNGQLLAQFDGPPVQGKLPTSTWPPQTIIEGNYILSGLAIKLDYEIRVGLYNSTTGERLSASAAGKEVTEYTLPLTLLASEKPQLPLVQQSEISTTKVVVALQPIAQGQEFNPGSIGRRDWPAGNLPSNYISNEATIIGRVAKQDIVQGQVIVQNMMVEQAHFARGIIADPNGDTAANIEHLKQLGMTWVRFQMPWKYVEPQEGQYEWATWDELIKAYADQDINVLLTINKAPDWARPDDDDKSVEGLPETPSLYADFVAEVATRYPEQVQAIELWSEPNIYYAIGGQGRVDVVTYVELLKAAYPAIKAVNPEITVVSGALVPTGAPEPAAIDDVEYLGQMYANGAQGYFDALGAHPSGFANPPDAVYEGGDYDPNRGYDDHRSFFFYNTLEAYRQVMVENGDEATLIWPTEFGWPVSHFTGDERFKFAQENTMAEQAEYTVRAFEMGYERPWVGPMFLWNLDYNITAPNTALANFGILGTPTYDALVEMSGNLPTQLPLTTTQRTEPEIENEAEKESKIVMVLDLSGSMAAEDFAPNRLDAAKIAMNAFIEQQPPVSIRLGLVTFATNVIGQIQPTLDYTMLQGALDSTQLSWDIGLDSGTAIGIGLQAAVDLLSDSQANHKVIILLTDGANNSGQIEPLAVAQAASDNEIRVYTIGLVGQGPARIVFPDGRVEQRTFDIDEEMLQKIAEDTGGKYFSTDNTPELQDIYEQIIELEAGE